MIHVTKPISDPARGVMFWQHLLAQGRVQLSNVQTTLTPNGCDVHGFFFDCERCPACEPVAPRSRQLEMFGGSHG